MSEAAEVRQRRRRGAALEQALLSAAWDELTAVGYARFTIEGVAARAHTSTPVLYRRWPDRWELAMAAFRQYADQNPVTAPDTGSLRGDLIGYLRDASAKRSVVGAVFSLGAAAHFEEAGRTPGQMRDEILRGRRTVLGEDSEVYERAAQRGEIDLGTLTPRMRALPFDLLRHELMLTLRPVPLDVIEQIVDDIALPVLTQGRRNTAAVLDARRLRNFLAAVVPSRAKVVAEADGWSVFIPGLPLAADGNTLDDAITDMIEALREYADDWQDRLLNAPNHRDNWDLVQLIELSTDDELKAWLRGDALPDRGEPQPPAEALPAEVAYLLRERVRLSESEIAAMSRDEAIARLQRYWTQGS